MKLLNRRARAMRHAYTMVSETVRDDLAALAARPLSENAAAHMRAALDDSDSARASLVRIRAEATNSHEERY